MCVCGENAPVVAAARRPGRSRGVVVVAGFVDLRRFARPPRTAAGRQAPRVTLTQRGSGNALVPRSPRQTMTDDRRRSLPRRTPRQRTRTTFSARPGSTRLHEWWSESPRKGTTLSRSSRWQQPVTPPAAHEDASDASPCAAAARPRSVPVSAGRCHDQHHPPADARGRGGASARVNPGASRRDGPSISSSSTVLSAVSGLSSTSSTRTGRRVGDGGLVGSIAAVRDSEAGAGELNSWPMPSLCRDDRAAVQFRS